LLRSINWLYAWRCFGVLAFLAMLLAGMRAEPFPQVISHFDKLLHFSAFFALCLAVMFSRLGPIACVWLLFLFGFGVAIEYGQDLMLPRRTADALDVVANTAGILAGLLVSFLSRVVAGRISQPRRQPCE